MLTLSYKKDETFTLVLPNGSHVHGCIESVSPGKVRIVWAAPLEVNILRDTVSADRAYSRLGRNVQQ